MAEEDLLKYEHETGCKYCDRADLIRAWYDKYDMIDVCIHGKHRDSGCMIPVGYIEERARCEIDEEEKKKLAEGKQSSLEETDKEGMKNEAKKHKSN